MCASGSMCWGILGMSVVVVLALCNAEGPRPVQELERLIQVKHTDNLFVCLFA